jgi:hypothetical protein
VFVPKNLFALKVGLLNEIGMHLLPNQGRILGFHAKIKDFWAFLGARFVYSLVTRTGKKRKIQGLGRILAETPVNSLPNWPGVLTLETPGFPFSGTMREIIRIALGELE